MSDDDLICPNCGRDEHLQGSRRDEVIEITCTACELSWIRDPSPRCVDCGTSDEVKAVPTPLIEKSRGSQLSITGLQVVYRCYGCERRAAAQANYRHIPPDQNPAG